LKRGALQLTLSVDVGGSEKLSPEKVFSAGSESGWSSSSPILQMLTAPDFRLRDELSMASTLSGCGDEKDDLGPDETSGPEVDPFRKSATGNGRGGLLGLKGAAEADRDCVSWKGSGSTTEDLGLLNMDKNRLVKEVLASEAG
jgi:hypothetical protein